MGQSSAVNPATCPHCGRLHLAEGHCPEVKAIEYYENGAIKRVEYLTPADRKPDVTHFASLGVPASGATDPAYAVGRIDQVTSKFPWGDQGPQRTTPLATRWCGSCVDEI